MVPLIRWTSKKNQQKVWTSNLYTIRTVFQVWLYELFEVFDLLDSGVGSYGTDIAVVWKDPNADAHYSIDLSFVNRRNNES